MNWYGIHKNIVEKSEGRITPEMVGTFTLPEIELYLADPKGHCPDGSTNMNEFQIEAEVARWASMTPLERLRAYQR